MTSTSFNVGLNDEKRLSSRVLRPPGGGHTDIFGGEAEPQRGRRAAPAAPGRTLGEEPAKPTNGAEPCQNGSAEAQEPTTPQESAKPAPIESKPEPQPEIKQDSKPQSPVKSVDQPRAEAPKRVRVPPGGFSSGLW